MKTNLLLSVLCAATVCAQQPAQDKLAGQPAEVSAWAYAYRADRRGERASELLTNKEQS